MSTRIAPVMVLVCAMWVSTVGTADAQDAAIAGRIKVASGPVFVVRAGAEVPAAVGEPLYETDVLKTGPDGRLGLTLKDETRVSLGPSSELRIDAFRFSPGESPLSI